MALHSNNERAIASYYTTLNPLLDSGEILVETDTGKYKMGDGVTLWADLPYAGAQVGATATALTPTTGAAVINLALGGIITHALTGNPSYTTSNRVIGSEVNVIITADGSERTFTFPAWTFVGTKPTVIAASKIARLNLLATGTTEASVIANYDVLA